MQTRYTTCPRDCPDACQIAVTVEEGRATRLQGAKDHPVTQGFLCARTSRFLERQYDPERLCTPLVRVDGELKPTTWDAALDLVAERLSAIRAESGPAAILNYRSGGSLGLLKELTDRYFAHFGPVTVKGGDICSGAGEAAQRMDFGGKGQNDLDDLANAKTIVLWGKNPSTSSPHLLPRLRDAKKAGAKLWLLDPVHHRTAREVDVVVAPRPGGDIALALGVARRCHERGAFHPEAKDFCRDLDAYTALVNERTTSEWAALADVDVEVINALAEDFANGPVTVLVGWGMARRAFGGTCIRAIDALCAVTGNVGVPGAGASFITSRKTAVDERVLKGPAAPRELMEPLLGHEILAATDPPVRAAYISCGNPVAMLPDSTTTKRALESLDFVVVADTHLTDTAACADVVLPVATFLEHDDLVGSYGHAYLGVQQAAVPPLDGARTDLEIIQGLAARTGHSEVMAGDADEWRERLLAPIEEEGVTLATLKQGPVRSPREPQVAYAGRRFLTEDGLCHLITMLPEGALSSPHRPEGTLTLMSLSTPLAQCSQWARPPTGPAEARVHPDAAGGVADGGRARLTSEVGTMEVMVRHDPELRSDVVVVAKGGHLAAGLCANALVPAALTDLGGGGALYDVAVRLAPAS